MSRVSFCGAIRCVQGHRFSANIDDSDSKGANDRYQLPKGFSCMQEQLSEQKWSTTRSKEGLVALPSVRVRKKCPTRSRWAGIRISCFEALPDPRTGIERRHHVAPDNARAGRMPSSRGIHGWKLPPLPQLATHPSKTVDIAPSRTLSHKMCGPPYLHALAHRAVRAFGSRR